MKGSGIKTEELPNMDTGYITLRVGFNEMNNLRLSELGILSGFIECDR
jgi:hypothetical protein